MRSRRAGAGPRVPARRRDSTYLPGFGSGSAGRGAAGALPPSFLLPPAPAPQRDTQYSPEAEAAPRGSCQWKLGCRRATAGGPSGACRTRRRGGGGEDQLEESGAGGRNAVVQVTRGIRWRKRAAHAHGGALKPIALRAPTGAGASGTVPPRVRARTLAWLGWFQVALGAVEGGAGAGCGL